MARFSEGIYEPITVLILASMVTPFGLTIAYFLGKIIRKNILNRQEIDTLKTAFPMGICQITEGCFPIVLNDLARNVIATGVGGAVGGGLSMLWGADSRIPASGMFAVATMTRPWAFIGSWFFCHRNNHFIIEKTSRSECRNHPRRKRGRRHILG